MDAVCEKKYARVAIEGGLKKKLVYAVPESLDGELAVGAKVAVPLGKSNRETWGYVVEFIQTPDYDPSKIKEIISGPPNKFKIPDELLKLADFLSDYYCTPLGMVLKTIVPPAVRKPHATHKFLNYVERNDTIEKLREACVQLRKRAPKQAQVLEAMLNKHKAVSVSELSREVGISAESIRALAKKGLLKIVKKQQYRDFLKEDVFIKVEPKQLNQAQQQIFDKLQKVLDEGKFHVDLVHGITGSGKTEIYLQLIDHARSLGKSAIVLVPEISLTPQTIEHFKSRFDENIAILHSRLSSGERHDEWHRILSGQAKIVIGPRSAVFAPVKNLGIIVVDEEHDGSYKQQEQMPLYNARDVAVVRAFNENAVVVLGSATPSMESYYNAAQGKYELSVLPGRIFGRSLPKVKIIDMRREQAQSNSFVVVADSLLSAIDERITMGEQVILFLNRRGFSRFALCTKCGEVIKCENCSISLKYHRSGNRLMCHLCGYSKPMSRFCEKCGTPSISGRGVGTQRIETILNTVLSDARVLRMDWDTTRGKRAHSRILDDFRRGKGNILLGTQMIAKGLDFHNVTLVGILDADVSLNLSDFRAGEQTFQIITQVAGRSGRGEVPGEVYIQTFNPEHPAIIAAGQQDYIAFYGREFKFREELQYPPLRHMIAIGLQGDKESDVVASAGKLARCLEQQLPKPVSLLDPSGFPLFRVRGRYRHRMFLLSQDVRAAADTVKQVLPQLKIKSSVKIIIDVDPISVSG